MLVLKHTTEPFKRSAERKVLRENQKLGRDVEKLGREFKKLGQVFVLQRAPCCLSQQRYGVVATIRSWNLRAFAWCAVSIRLWNLYCITLIMITLTTNMLKSMFFLPNIISVLSNSTLLLSRKCSWYQINS